jgi:hypothetical protein
MARPLQILSLLVGLVANLITIAGILYGGWDTFQLLMLYWTETVILMFWTLMRLSRLAKDECGTFTVNGKVQAATPLSLLGFFSLHAGAFILGHLLFLWLLFSREWLENIHSAREFFYGLFVAHGIWVALLMFFAMHLAAFLANPHPAPAPQKPGAEKPDPVGGIVATLYGRIVIMQVGIIFGAWFSGFTGSRAPLLIVMVLKTLGDLSGSSPRSAGKLSFSSGNKTTTIGT